METITWVENLSVKNYLIDSQHKKLIAVMNDLIESFNDGRKKEHIQTVLDELVSAVEQHFSSEERLLIRAKYPDYDDHKKGHDKLVEKIVSFQKMFRDDKIPLSMEVMQYLRNWLLHHVQESDSDFKGLL